MGVYMNIGLLMFIIAVIFLMGFIIKKKNSNNKIDENIQNIETKNDMERLFFYEVKNGEKKCKLTHILDEFDFMFIKTLFNEECIPYYMEEDKTLNIWPQRKVGIFGNINLYILERDYDNVIKLINDNRKSNV